MAGAIAAGPPPFPIARFSVEQYHRMIAAGAFTEHDRVELIEGWVVEQMANGPSHELAVGNAEDHLRAHVPPGWHVRNQAPITLARSEPEPDLAVVRGDRQAYRLRHPGAVEVNLVVEVSDTTLATDRLKGATYGHAGIATYWIVNLVDRCVEVYTSPSTAHPQGYAVRELLGPTKGVPLVVGGQTLTTLAVSALLP